MGRPDEPRGEAEEAADVSKLCALVADLFDCWREITRDYPRLPEITSSTAGAPRPAARRCVWSLKVVCFVILRRASPLPADEAVVREEIRRVDAELEARLPEITRDYPRRSGESTPSSRRRSRRISANLGEPRRVSANLGESRCEPRCESRCESARVCASQATRTDPSKSLIECGQYKAEIWPRYSRDIAEI